MATPHEVGTHEILWPRLCEAVRWALWGLGGRLVAESPVRDALLREAMKIQANDPGQAARLAFAAAWLFSRTSEMNAENDGRSADGAHLAYDGAAFTAIQREAVEIAETGGMPLWLLDELDAARGKGEG